MEAWDRIEEGRSLTLEECKAKEFFKKWDLLNEMHLRQKSRELWLKAIDKNTGFL